MKIHRLTLALLLLSPLGVTPAADSPVVPHSVPLEFASDRYGVTVNGKPVTAFFAAMNLHFASFDFEGQADVQVTINEADYNGES